MKKAIIYGLMFILMINIAFAALVIEQQQSNTYEGLREDRPKATTLNLQNGSLSNIIISWHEDGTGTADKYPYNVTIYSGGMPVNIQSDAYISNCRNNTVNASDADGWRNVTMPSGCSLSAGNHTIVWHKGGGAALIGMKTQNTNVYGEGAAWSSTDSGQSFSVIGTDDDLAFYVFSGVGAASTGVLINLTNSTPVDDTFLNNSLVHFNITADVSTNNVTSVNASLYINNTLNQSRSFNPGDNIVIVFNQTLNDGNWSYFINVSAMNGTTLRENQTSSTNYIMVDTVQPTITPDSINQNKKVIYDVLRGQINVTDSNLFSLLFTINGTAITNVTNIESPYYYNYSVNVTNYTPRVYNATIRACDGHTAKQLKEKYEIDDKLSGLEFKTDNKWIKVNPENTDLFDSFDVTKRRDRFSYKYKKSFMGKLFKKDFVFIVESSDVIYIMPNNPQYKAWMTVPTIGENGRWIDFNIKDYDDAVYNVERINDKKVKVTISNVDHLDELEFESVGELNCNSQTYQFLKYGYTLEAQNAIENQLVNFSINFTVDTSFVDNINTTLDYNTTLYSSPAKEVTTVGTTAYYHFNQPIYTLNISGSLGNASYFWNYSINATPDVFNITQSYNQTIRAGSIDNCTGNSVYAINFTVRDELEEVYKKANFEMAVIYEVGNVEKNYSFEVEDSWNVSLCMSPAYSNFTADITLQYEVAGYPQRDYVEFGYNVDNVTDLITLYALSTGNTTEITLHVIDDNDDDLQNILIKAYRWDIANNSDILVETEYTDSDGNAIFDLKQGTEYYYFEFYQNEELVLSTSKFKIFSTELEYIIGETTSTVLGEWLTINNIAANITYSNITKIVSFQWVDSSSLADRFCLNLTRANGSVEYSACGTSSPLTHTITDENVSYMARGMARYTDSGNWYVLTTRSIGARNGFKDFFGTDVSLMLGFILFVFISTLMLVNKNIAVGGAMFAVILLYFLGIIPGIGMMMGLLAIGTIILVILNKRAV